MVKTAGSEQAYSPYHEAWILKGIVRIKTDLIGPGKQWYSHLPLKINKNWQVFCRKF